MSIFENILGKIWHAAETALGPGGRNAAAEPAIAPVTPTSATTPTAPAAVSPGSDALGSGEIPSSKSTQPVDVEAVLTTMAAQKGDAGNWKTSIVDLLKLLDLDSSLAARAQLANEIDVHVSADGTADENLALHKAVMQKLADNGGKVPDSLKG